MPGLQIPIGGMRELGTIYWQEYDTSVERFREKPTEDILAYLETRGFFEKLSSYSLLSRAKARKRAARDTLKERL